MARSLLMEQLHISLYITRGMPEKEAARIHRTLNGARFLRRLTKTLRRFLRSQHSLAQVRCTVTR